MSIRADVLYKEGADAHFSDLQIITVKPGDSLWTVDEITAVDARVATLLLSEEQLDALKANPTGFAVNKLKNPNGILSV
jgi:hypothetical protein